MVENTIKKSSAKSLAPARILCLGIIYLPSPAGVTTYSCLFVANSACQGHGGGSLNGSHVLRDGGGSGNGTCHAAPSVRLVNGDALFSRRRRGVVDAKFSRRCRWPSRPVAGSIGVDLRKPTRRAHIGARQLKR